MKLVESVAKPGGNVTGLSNFGSDLAGKRLQILKENVPNLSRVGFLINSNLPATAMYIQVMTEAAGQIGLELKMRRAPSTNWNQRST